MSDEPIPLNSLQRGFAEQAAELTEAMQRVLASGWYVHGPEHRRFEDRFAAFLGSRHGVAVGNGTDALVLALQAAIETTGRNEVITAANAGGYATAAARQLGLVPRYADVDPDSLCLTAATIEPLLGAGTAAVVVTHLYGRMADVEPIVELCERNGVMVVEDCAQSVGATRAGRRAGTIGHIGTFSFYPTKNLGALGDGGALVTDRADLADYVRRARQYGWSEKYIVAQDGGRNSRLDELQAAVLNLRLPHVDRWNSRRRSIVKAYAAAARPERLRVLPATGEDHAAHLAVAIAADRNEVVQQLARAEVATDVHYPIPDHVQPGGWRRAGETPSLPVTEHAAKHIMSLPCFPQMTDEEIEVVCDVLRQL